MNVQNVDIYASSQEHLLDELVKLDALIHLQVLRFRETDTDQLPDEFMGLLIPDGQIDELLRNGQTHRESLSSSEEALMERIEEIGKRVSEKEAASVEQDIYLTLHRLALLFNLTPFERDCVLICLAPELDLKYEKLYAYLQNDVTRKRPSTGLILNLLYTSFEDKLNARFHLSPHMTLWRYQILRAANDPSGESMPFLSQPLKLDDRIADFLLSSGCMSPDLEPFVRQIKPCANLREIILPEGTKDQLNRLIQHHFDGSRKWEKLIFYFQGNYGSGRKLVAEALCNQLGLSLIVIDIKKLLGSGLPFESLVWLAFREGPLQAAAIYVEHFDCLFDGEHDGQGKGEYRRNIVINAIQEFSCLTFLSGEKEWEQAEALSKHVFARVKFPNPPYALRVKLWNSLLNGSYSVSHEVNTDILANQFNFTGGQIRNAVMAARNLAMMRDGADLRITQDDLCASCRAQSNQKLGSMARKLDPHYTWVDIVLPSDVLEQLKEICNYVKHRQRVYTEWGFDKKLSLGKGLSALFSGTSGTGKTMAAEIIAGELNIDMYKIDLSCVVSKYIGETEKNLSRIFREAEQSNAILFFDEADALFGKRSEVKDAHDRYANIEINYLLQKMEEYEGIVILATNLRKNMDEAFLRRLRFVVEFPFPDERHRYRIWQGVFPQDTPRDPEIDYEFLARQFQISGGNIKNIALAAAFLAAADSGLIKMEHLIRSTKRELQKMGKLYTEADFGKYSYIVKM